MDTVMALWLPILLSAVVIFFASFVIHMVLRYHWKDFRKVANEDEALEAFRRMNLEAGEYAVPMATNPAEMKDPAFIEKMTRGPVVMMAVKKGGPPTMGAALVQWFIYCVVVSYFTGYLTARALGSGVDYKTVFCFAGVVAFMGYGLALWQSFIWYARPLRNILLQTFDALVYALLTAGVFGWLWPR